MLVGGAAGALIGDLWGRRVAFGATAASSLASMALFVANLQDSIALGSSFGSVVVDHFGIAETMRFSGATGLMSLAVPWLFSTGTATRTVQLSTES
jgi:predicted MFS family arabinose efflux permease